MFGLSHSLQCLVCKVQIALLLLAGLSSCDEPQVKAPQTRAFPMVSVPSILSGEEALEYAAEHFWESYLDTSRRWLSDSTHISGVDAVKVEEMVGNYTTILGMIPLGDARRCMASLFRDMEARADSATFAGLTSLICRYMYDPNSPVRNEDIYQPFAQGLGVSSRVAESRRRGYLYEASMCSLNAVGTPAADFTFTDARGRRHTLYGVHAPLTLLFFSNPGCPNCREIMESLTEEGISALVEDGTLAIVNIYIDEDLASWRAYEPSYPRSWHTGYDQDYIIRTNVLYNVRAIPSLYLLDEDKTVLLKDATPDRVLSAIASLLNPGA